MNVLPRQYSDNVEIDGLLSQYYWNPPANQATRWSLLSESDSSVWYAETEDLRAIARTQDLTMIDSAFST